MERSTEGMGERREGWGRGGRDRERKEERGEEGGVGGEEGGMGGDEGEMKGEVEGLGDSGTCISHLSCVSQLFCIY